MHHGVIVQAGGLHYLSTLDPARHLTTGAVGAA
jgi:hypothetical protein